MTEPFKPACDYVEDQIAAENRDATRLTLLGLGVIALVIGALVVLA